MVIVRVLLVWISALGLLTAADAPPSGAATTIQSADFFAWDDRFDGPDTLSAGLTTLRLHNLGQAPHQLQFVKLEEGHSATELIAYLRAFDGTMPQWVKHMGGPNGIGPGDQAEATVDLEPGLYVVSCAIRTARSPHGAVPGMPKMLRVSPARAARPQFAGSIHMALFDHEFVVVEPFDRGRHTIYVVNRGRHVHQVSLVQLAPGASPEDVQAAFDPAASGRLPGKLLGGMAGLAPGGRGTFHATLSPGSYAIMCLFPHPEALDNHSRLGMVMTFTVE